MKRLVGTTIRGLRTPIINEGDDLLEILPPIFWQTQLRQKALLPPATATCFASPNPFSRALKETTRMSMTSLIPSGNTSRKSP